MTSVAAYDYRGQTVAFTGTRSGRMKKVGTLEFMSVSVCVRVGAHYFLCIECTDALVTFFDESWMYSS